MAAHLERVQIVMGCSTQAEHAVLLRMRTQRYCDPVRLEVCKSDDANLLEQALGQHLLVERGHPVFSLVFLLDRDLPRRRVGLLQRDSDEVTVEERLVEPLGLGDRQQLSLIGLLLQIRASLVLLLHNDVSVNSPAQRSVSNRLHLFTMKAESHFSRASAATDLTCRRIECSK